MTINLAHQIEEQLPEELLELLKAVGKLADAQGQAIYLVGGAVRDLLLGRPILDFDLVVAGDAPLLARRLARERGGEVQTHPRFGTAKFRHGDLTIDLTTARSETYERPGALPTVKPGSIDSDLFRRDFSVNAMAIHLSPTRFAELVDPYGGKADLDRRLIRILHEKSFIDDATRILRAVRYEQRLGFGLEPNTEKLLRRDVVMLDTISGDRIRHELELILNEERPERILSRAEDLGVLQKLHPSLQGNGWLAERFELARSLGQGMPALYWSLLIYSLSPEEVESLIERLKIWGETRRALRDLPQLKVDLPSLAKPSLSNSHLCRLLDSRSPIAIQALALASDVPIVRQRLQLYLDKLRWVKPILDGEALKGLGVPPGPRLGFMLRALREARLDGKAETRDEEEALLRRWLAGQR